MRRVFVFLGLLAVVAVSTSLFGQGPCSAQSNKLACVIPQEYGVQAGKQNFNFGTVLYEPASTDHHPGHFSSDFGTLLGPLTGAIGRQANLLPVASPSSGVLLSYDPSVKTFVVTTNSLGPILGERGETVGRHKLFVGFTYQFFNFDKIDGVNLRNVPAVLIHTDDGEDNSTSSARVTCSTNMPQSGSPIESDGANNLTGCAFVRDRINSVSSVDLKISQYTGYITFGLTSHIDVSMVIPFERVHMGVFSQNTIVLGSDGSFVPAAGSPDSPTGTTPNLNQNNPPNGPPTNGAPYFFHVFKNCPNTSPAAGASALDPSCLNHSFPDPGWIGATFAADGTETPGTPSGSAALNNASGIGDIVARVKWNAWSGERLKIASGLDVRFPTGDALNYLGSGSYGFKPFAVLSYRARVSPHVMVGYEWNGNSILSSRVRLAPPAFQGGPSPNSLGLLTGQKGYMPSDLLYSAGADAWITKWLTGSFDIVGARFFRAGTESVVQGQYLAPCTAGCLSAPGSTVPSSTLVANGDASYSVTNASAGVKIRILPKVSKLVLTANVLVRLDNGGLHSKPAPMVGLGYTF